PIPFRVWAGGAPAWAASRLGPGPAHFFLACCAWALLCRIFFCSLGSFVAGFLATRLLVLVMACPPFGQKNRDGPDQRGAETNRMASDSSGLSGGDFALRQGLPAVHPTLGGRDTSRPIVLRTPAGRRSPLSACRPTTNAAGVAWGGPTPSRRHRTPGP